MFQRVFLALWLAVIALFGQQAGVVQAEGVVDYRGNLYRAGVSGKVDPYSPTDWFMRLDVRVLDVYGQPVVGAPITFERSCRPASPCPFKGTPEQIGQTDQDGKLTYSWVERNVGKNTQQTVEAVVNIYIAPEWSSLDVYYTVGNHSVGSEFGE